MRHDLYPEVLRKTADLIRRDGWTRFSFEGEDGEHCIMGALNMVVAADLRLGLADDRGALVDELFRTVYPGQPGEDEPPYNRLMWWNDHQANGPTDVIAVLESTAARLEKEKGA